MTTGLATVVANTILDSLSGAPWVPPAALYVQLHVGDPGSAGTANILTGPPRVQITGWNPAANGTKVTASVPTWSNWSFTSPATITHVSCWDAASSGNFQFSAPAQVAAQIVTGNTLTLASLTITLSPLAA